MELGLFHDFFGDFSTWDKKILWGENGHVRWLCVVEGTTQHTHPKSHLARTGGARGVNVRCTSHLVNYFTPWHFTLLCHIVQYAIQIYANLVCCGKIQWHDIKGLKICGMGTPGICGFTGAPSPSVSNLFKFMSFIYFKKKVHMYWVRTVFN